MELGNFKKRFEELKEAEPEKAVLRFQDFIPKIIKEYEIKPPQTFRIWKLAKQNLGFIETTLKGLEDGMKGTKPENAGLLISKLFPSKLPKGWKVKAYTIAGHKMWGVYKGEERIDGYSRGDGCLTKQEVENAVLEKIENKTYQ